MKPSNDRLFTRDVERPDQTSVIIMCNFDLVKSVELSLLTYYQTYMDTDTCYPRRYYQTNKLLENAYHGIL